MHRTRISVDNSERRTSSYVSFSEFLRNGSSLHDNYSNHCELSLIDCINYAHTDSIESAFQNVERNQ